MKSFQVSPCVFLAESSIPAGQNEEAYGEKLKWKYKPMVTEIMMPDTLRKTPTEVEKYLDSRPSIPLSVATALANRED